MMNTMATTHEAIGDMKYLPFHAFQPNPMYEPEHISSTSSVLLSAPGKLSGKISTPALFEETFNGEPIDIFEDLTNNNINSIKLTNSDVLVGRHRQAFNHVGNRRFRVVVSMFLPRYFQNTSRRDRSILNLEIVETVQRSGGRFLKENKFGQLVEISEKEKRNKVGHALRDAAAASASNQGPKKSKAKKVMKQERLPNALEKYVTTAAANDLLSDEDFDLDTLFC